MQYIYSATKVSLKFDGEILTADAACSISGQSHTSGQEHTQLVEHFIENYVYLGSKNELKIENFGGTHSRLTLDEQFSELADEDNETDLEDFRGLLDYSVQKLISTKYHSIQDLLAAIAKNGGELTITKSAD